ncbi:MAG: ABC transporter permease subunit [Actinomycetota bacterium]
MASGLAAGAAGLVLAAVVAFLVTGARSGPLDWAELLTSPVWDPVRGRFGATAMLWGTAAVSVVALGLAAPVGWAAAVAIVELAPRRWRRVLRSGAELLAVVPSIVYGLIGIAYLRPFVAGLAGVPGGDSLLAAALVLAVMVLPTIVAVSADALDDVPAGTREAAAACGLTRTEVVRSAVLPLARRGMGAAALLALARALGETIAVFLVVGRADGRFPSSAGDVLDRLVRPGQTLTTKLNGPESVLAGTAGPHWAALCGLGLVLLAGVVALTLLGQRRAGVGGGGVGGRCAAPGRLRRADVGLAGWGQAVRDRAGRVLAWAVPGRLRRADVGGTGGVWRRRRAAQWGPAPGRAVRDRAGRVLAWAVLAGVLLLVGAVVAVVAGRGGTAFDPGFWWSPAQGASGGGIRDQLAGTLLLVAVAGVLAAPVGLGLGLVVAEYARPGAARWLRSLVLTLGGVPSILLGLCGYWLFATRLGWGKSWLAGSVVLAVVAVPPVVIAVASAVAGVPPGRREAALGLGLRRAQVVRSVLVPSALPGLVTGLLLGLARAAGETAPLLFTATVFSGAPTLPAGVRESPVAALPTHIFILAQDAAEPAARQAAWGSAVALIVVAAVLVLAAVPARRRLQRSMA